MKQHIAVVALVGILGASATASARCPSSGLPSREVCKDVDAFFMPGAVGMAYLPRASSMGKWFGAGVQLVPFMWSHNTDKFGPGQGKLIFDIGILGSTADGVGGEPAPGRMLFYRSGAQLSFERNASRTFAIPFFGATFGGMHERDLGDVGFFEATVGVHGVYLKNIVVTLEGGYLFPFDKVDELAGPRVTLAVNFTMW